MKPNVRTEWNGVRFSTNRLGYRTPEVSIPKPKGVFRIVILGSSNTMGHGVNDDEMYARLLEDWLNSPEAGTDRRVEVVNLAVSSDSPSQNLVRLQEDVPALEPDWILNDVTVLDYSLEELHLHTIVRKNREIPFGYLRTILLNAGVSPSDTRNTFSAKLRGTTEAILDGAYEGWIREANSLGVPLTLIHLPRTDAPIENRNLRRLAERLAARHSIPMIDLTDAYGDRKISEYRLSPWDKHPSVLGHRLIFEKLRDALIRGEGPPELGLGTELSRGDRDNGERPTVNPA
jgi:lysophospholipase L1-like esterase